MANWQPSAPIKNLQLRADVLATIRAFFRERGVLEVETPLLAGTTVTDPHLHSIEVPNVFSAQANTHYLQTSPEFAMKRLLAAGSGSIYQMGKAFRRDESGSRHSPEFTLLEWYRVGFDESQLMDEVEELVRQLTSCQPLQRISYRELFQTYLGIDPFACDRDELFSLARRKLDLHSDNYSRDDLLQLMLAQLIEPALKENCFVYHFPASMAALSRIEKDANGNAVARRFELFMNGMEIANGYFELTDPAEQKARFEADNRQRAAMGLATMPVDEQLLAALQHGMPTCAGVALGVDRLLMVIANTDRIEEVIAFKL